MFTSIDKAVVAVVMAGLFLLNEFTGVDLGLSQDTVAAIITAATPLLVYLVPNRRAAA